MELKERCNTVDPSKYCRAAAYCQAAIQIGYPAFIARHSGLFFFLSTV